MKILVTGGIGNIGFVVVKHLLKCGYDLRVIDNKPIKELEPDILAEIQNTEYLQVDIRDYQATKACVEGMDLIVHLAAIPHPMNGQDTEIFQINAGGTFNIYQAASELGVKRIVSASSINFLGNGFGKRFIDVKYFPIDEEHPGHATDVYAFSKQLVEHIAAYFWQRNEITSACMRFPFVYNPRYYPPDRRDQYLRNSRESFARLMELPEEKRRKSANKLLEINLQLRNQSMNGEISYPEMLQTLNDIPGGMLMFGYSDFWTILHVEDAALSIERAIIADFQGYHPFYIAAPQNVFGLPTRDLAEMFYPKVTTWKRDIQGSQALLNCEMAKSILGFEAGVDYDSL